MSEIALVDRVICAAARAWENDGEVLATGIGLVPRLAASLCMRSINTDLMMTDSEAWVVNEPVPVGPRGEYKIKRESWMGFSRIFDNVWGGKRHAMVGPVQVDRFGQGNISMVGSDYARPKSMMLGVRGFPGNSINHANSFFVPNHSTKVFVPGEVDAVGSVGYNPARLAKGWTLEETTDIRFIFTNLCVMDFGGPSHQVRLVSLHPGVTAAQVQEATGFPIHVPESVGVTPDPTPEQLALLAQLDPHNLRATAMGV
ncbi:acyl CoA--acetate/3-ketoacid CoA transferase [Comamonas thiooxydans]|uniref:acyl CoA--acetate/3-ketoacid CoA transferase n=1 Tax=Comamonas thiooxydans TaxID=363952 RepID=UPI0001BB16DF|nr:acyl CoA--acetate/3-ketoacid CoA transferase [Comamonas thiooxydans]ACY32023.1 acyl CoA:acetate/3-ketoacid CoA transferase [Comamonas thiooxydans]MDO1473942.1 acyl CoA--acetate/3-ketoacid CoA transferase [Comamonas thiooxydans]